MLGRKGNGHAPTVVIVGIASGLRPHRVVDVVRGVAPRGGPVGRPGQGVQFLLEGVEGVLPGVGCAGSGSASVEQGLTGVSPGRADVRPAAVVVSLRVGVRPLAVGGCSGDVRRAASAAGVARPGLRPLFRRFYKSMPC